MINQLHNNEKTDIPVFCFKMAASNHFVNPTQLVQRLIQQYLICLVQPFYMCNKISDWKQSQQ